MTDTAKLSNLYVQNSLFLPGISNSSDSNILYYNTGSDAVSYAAPSAIGFSQGFCVSAEGLVLPGAPQIYTFVNLSTAVNGSFNDGGLLNTATGQITISTTGNYLVCMSIDYENNSASVATQDNLSLLFHDNTAADNLIIYEWQVIQNDTNNYSWSEVFRLTAGHTYEFRLSNTLAGTADINAGPRSRLSLQRLT